MDCRNVEDMTSSYDRLQVPMALTGDALFTLGCGRVFTGDFVRMQARSIRSRDGAWGRDHPQEPRKKPGNTLH